MPSELLWPPDWPLEAITAVERYVGSGNVLEIWVYHASSSDGTLIVGRLTAASDGQVEMADHSSERGDVCTLPLLSHQTHLGHGRPPRAATRGEAQAKS